jgi:hypothetical protein
VVALVLVPIRALLCLPAIAGLLIIFQVRSQSESVFIFILLLSLFSKFVTYYYSCFSLLSTTSVLSDTAAGYDRLGPLRLELAAHWVAPRMPVALWILLARHLLQLGLPLDHNEGRED